MFAAAGLVLALLLMAGCSSGPSNTAPPPAPDAAGGDGVRRSPVVAGRRARVFVMAGLPAPAIAITAAPSKGTVTFEPGQETTINTSASGTCIGQRVLGTGIYYTAREGETGADTFSIQAELGGDVTQRTFSVEIVQ